MVIQNVGHNLKMKIKRLIDLKESDLEEYPIWEHWYENNIEFVKPSNKSELFESDEKGYIVKTEFELKNGKKYIGFCSPKDTSGLDYIQPVLLTENGQFFIFQDNNWTIEEKENELRKIGLKMGEVFPIKYMTKIKCDGDYHFGKLLEFNLEEE